MFKDYFLFIDQLPSSNGPLLGESFASYILKRHAMELNWMQVEYTRNYMFLVFNGSLFFFMVFLEKHISRYILVTVIIATDTTLLR